MSVHPHSSARCSRSSPPNSALARGLRWPRLLGCALAALIGFSAHAAPPVLPTKAEHSAPHPLADHRIHVDRDTSGNGSSWQNAYPRQQDALAHARTLAPSQSVEVWVAAGAYYPNLGAGISTSDRTKAFVLSDNASIEADCTVQASFVPQTSTSLSTTANPVRRDLQATDHLRTRSRLDHHRADRCLQ